MIKIVHVSDVHIGASFKSSSFAKEFSIKRQNEIKETFFKVIDYVSNNEIDILIVSGDLFDSEYLKRSDVDNVFKELNNLECHVALIAGNHDPLKVNSYWRFTDFNDNVHLFDSYLSKIEINELNAVIYGHSWDRYYIDNEVFENINQLDKTKINILVGHGDIYNKSSEYLPINKNKLIDLGFDYVALGHIHKHDFVSDNIAYAGSLEPLDFSETGKHGFILGEINKEESNFEFIPFSKRDFKVCDINIDAEDTERDIFSKILNVDNEEGRNLHMYRIIFNGRYNHQIDLNSDYLDKIFEEEFNYVEFSNRAQYDFDIEILKKENSENIIGKFIEKFEEMGLDDPINKEAFYIGLQELLNSKEGVK